MNELGAIYRQALPAHISALESARAAVDVPAAAGAAIETVRRIAHSLRGSGGTYGFPQISEAAAAVEGAAEGELDQRLDRLIALLRSVADGSDDNVAADDGHTGQERAAPDEPVFHLGGPETASARRDDLVSRATLLIVDDDPEIRLLAGFVLRAAGYDVVEAEDSASAGAQLAAGGIDVVLMDVMLGAEDGIATAERLLGEQHRAPRLVFLTGATRPDQLARMSASSACGVLRKPFDPESLPAALERALAGTG